MGEGMQEEAGGGAQGDNWAADLTSKESRLDQARECGKYFFRKRTR